MSNGNKRITDLLSEKEQELITAWVEVQLRATTRRSDLIRESEIRQDSTEFIRLLRSATTRGNFDDVQGSEWDKVREMLSTLSRSRARMGFTPSETASFVFSLSPALIIMLRQQAGTDPEETLDAIEQASDLVTRLGLYTTEVYQKSRDEVILRQQEEMLELSTPVVKLWDGILALPLIGTLDSARTQVVMESLLQAIVDTGSEVAIIDITGVPTVDTLVSQHLLKTVAAARLMGADCIISGIRPQIAQTIVHLGVDLSMVSTKSSLAEAFVLALKRTGRSIGRQGAVIAAPRG
jgi:rsbT co-antagonist protein RsbR